MRKTSSYLLTVFTKEDPNPMCDALIRSCPVEVEASGVGRKRAFIRFRTATEEEALNVARRIRGDQPFVLSVGYGIHYRVVLEQAAPASGELLPAEYR